MLSDKNKSILYVLFTLSGFSGLIYESVWSHYLKLFLGHSAYAQALVLVIFMGGMAVGAWYTSRVSAQPGNLLLYYALIEAVIGVMGLLFDPVYQFVSNYSHEHMIPLLADSHYVHAWKLGVATALILPQSLLLGATFPLMTGGFIRKFTASPGKSIALFYFLNSIGAAISLLVTAFYFIGELGLPGTLMVAGVMNITIATLVWALVHELPDEKRPETQATAPQKQNQMILTASFLTGVASFIYEVTWIRMLSLVLGTSTFSFELMLSAFIFGLAIGGYLIRQQIDKFRSPLYVASMVQIIMGALAILTIFLYGYSFDLMSFLMQALDETEQGYVLFSLSSHAIALFIMLPATICAGMTLPLFTLILFRQGGGERSIGPVYASNTLGAITGVIFTLFIGLPAFGIEGSLITGAMIDIGTGVLLFMMVSANLRTTRLAYAVFLAAFTLLTSTLFHQYDARILASGVFRHGIPQLDEKTEILYHQDGKTATVTVTRWNNSQIAIMTNGKPDAVVTMATDKPPSIDEATMTLLAALPLSVHSSARTIANIGLGSGMTAHTALLAPEVARVDTIEIEEAIISGARHFMPKTGKVFEDPRSHLHVDDARTFFSSNRSAYDIIISEPSNPWVSGVSSLFTAEFYGHIKTNLKPGGLLAQWIHIYELDVDLLASILKAISASFPYYSLYFADEGNLILLASADIPIPYPQAHVFSIQGLNELMANVHIRHLDDLKNRFLGDQDLFGPFLSQMTIKANSDFYPILDIGAEKSRFMGRNVSSLLELRLSNVPVLDILYGDGPDRNTILTPSQYFPSDALVKARHISAYIHNRIFANEIIDVMASLNYLSGAASNCGQNYNEAIWVDALYMIMSSTVAHMGQDDLNTIYNAIKPACDNAQLSTRQNNWLELFRSFINGEHLLMNSMLVELIDAETQLSIDQQKFLFTSLMAGLVRQGEMSKATLLWNDYMRHIFDSDAGIPLAIRILLAQVPVSPVTGQ